jgi:hypothetical protein
VPAFEPVWAIRVAAEPGALDAAEWTQPESGEVTILRTAPDEAIAVGALGAEVPDGDAIALPETGLVVGHADLDEIERFVDWPLPSDRPAFAQGSVAGVPVKLLIRVGDSVDVYAWAAHAHDLAAKLGWTAEPDPRTP